MRYFYFELADGDQIVQHIIYEVAEDRWVTFPNVESNHGPERAAYLQWLAEGNSPELFTENGSSD